MYYVSSIQHKFIRFFVNISTSIVLRRVGNEPVAKLIAIINIVTFVL